MGHLLENIHVAVGLVRIPEVTANHMSERLVTRKPEDCGQFQTVKFSDLTECRDAMTHRKVSALCVWFRAFSTSELVEFIGDIRVTNPLVPICLVGTRRDLDLMPGLHKGWRERFSHYYKIAVDKDAHVFDTNIGIARDLFLADAIKIKGLGHYETTPGRILRVKYVQPLGFWIIVGATLVASMLGPLITYFLTAQK